MEEQNTMLEFMDEIEKSMKKIYKGDVLKGRVISANDEEITVDIGYISDGVIAKEEMADNSACKAGGEIFVYVMNPHDENGNVVLSHKKAEEILGWDDLEKAYHSKEKITVKAVEAVKGGVSALYRNVSCFIPGSLLSYRFVEDMNSYAGKDLEVIVEEFDREKKRAVLSRKAVEASERQKKKEKLLNELQEGEIRSGVVTKVVKFGAFVDLGGAEGFIHIDDLAWRRVKHPSEVIAEGEQVSVYIAGINKKTGKIGLVLKKVEDDPWKGVADYYKEGDLVEGTVVKLADFGAFVEIEEGVEGLVYVSEISYERVRKPEDVLKEGDRVQAVILGVDEPNRKISLSIREAEGRISKDIVQAGEERGTTIGDLIGDRLKDLYKIIIK